MSKVRNRCLRPDFSGYIHRGMFTSHLTTVLSILRHFGSRFKCTQTNAPPGEWNGKSKHIELRALRAKNKKAGTVGTGPVGEIFDVGFYWEKFSLSVIIPAWISMQKSYIPLVCWFRRSYVFCCSRACVILLRRAH